MSAAIDESGTNGRTALAERIAGIDWWHRIDLGDGIITPGRDKSAEKLARLHLPDRLDGLRVLDIGAWDGFFSFESERRGAARTVAMDRWDGIAGAGDAGFRLAASALGSRVEGVQANIAELDDATIGRLGGFDLVLFLGVLYHLREPMRALDNVRRLCAGRLILETETDVAFVRRPALAFYPGEELSSDPSNWFAPNLPALRGMLEASGFTDIRVVWRSSLAHRLARAAKHLLRHRTSPWTTLQRGRIVVHARARG